jgi:D-alanyl-D-alanine dipeptidase
MSPLLAGAALALAPTNAQLVELNKIVPDLILDVRYATENNFTKRRLYPVARVFLVRSAAVRLAQVQRDLRREGLRLKVYDGYRPLAVTKVMWDLIHDERYVADPAKGSRHNRGAAVDVTLLDGAGRELPMPTGYDDFSERAHRNYPGLSSERLRNRATLERAMARRGFVGLPTEWWHFDAVDWKDYPVLDIPLDQL